MKDESFFVASFGHILSDIKVLSTHFRHLVFRHTCRLGNKVAHNLARVACNFFPFCTWIKEVQVVSDVAYLAEISIEL